MSDNPPEGNTSTKFGVNHLGIVVRDVEKTAKIFEEVFGMGPFNILLREPDDIELHGEPQTVRLKSGLVHTSGIQIELVQVMEGKTAHKEFLDAGGFGLHHIGVFVQDFEGELKKWQEKGFEVLSRGKAYGAANWAYIDTRKELGFMYELIELPPLRSRKKPKKNE